MMSRSDRPAPDRAPLSLRSLIDRIAEADLDPVQIASMDLHLSHLLRVRKDWASSSAILPAANSGIASADHGVEATA